MDLSQIAHEYGLHPVQVGQWKREIQVQAKTLFEGKRGPQPIATHSAADRPNWVGSRIAAWRSVRWVIWLSALTCDRRRTRGKAYLPHLISYKAYSVFTLPLKKPPDHKNLR